MAYLSCSAGRTHFARTNSGLLKFALLSHALCSDKLIGIYHIPLHRIGGRGGPTSAEHNRPSAGPAINISGNSPAHVSAESTSNISPDAQPHKSQI